MFQIKKKEDDLELLFNETTLSKSFDQELFSVSDFTNEALINGRRGYYYGDLIVSAVIDKHSVKEALEMSYKQWLEYIKAMT